MSIPTVRRPWPIRGSRGALAAAALLLGAAVAALAQAPSGELVSIERLRFEKKCFFEVKEWHARGGDAFLAKLEDQKKLYQADKEKASQVGTLEVLLAEAYWARKTEQDDAGDMDGASHSATAIVELDSKDPKVLDLKKQANRWRVQQNYGKAEKFLRNGDLKQAHDGFVNCVGAEDADIAAKVVSSLVQIAKTNGKYDEVMKGNELDAEGTMLAEVLGVLKTDLGKFYEVSRANPDLGGLEKARDEIQNTSQLVQVDALDVGDLGGYKGKSSNADPKTAIFSLAPAGSGKPFPAAGGPAKFPKIPFRWHRGTYDVRVYVPGEKLPFMTRLGLVLGKDPAVLKVPSRIPEGMVWLPAEGGGESLFVDRYEVTVKQVEDLAAASGDEKLAAVVKDSREGKAEDDQPAWFAAEDAVAAYEKATGKRVPTNIQWLQAAFGSFGQAQRPFPWGTAAPDSTRAYTKERSSVPAKVGERPAGASPCGAEDMAGNLCEWVRLGGQFWVLGGDYQMGEQKLSSFEGRNPLRDPRPGPTVFKGMTPEQQNQFAKYKYDPDNEIYNCGLRTVIPVQAK